MIDEPLRIEHVRAGDARFAWAKEVEYTIFGVENDFADQADIAAGEMVHYRSWERFSEIYVGCCAQSPDMPVGVLRALRFDPQRGLDSFSTLRDARNFSGPTGDTRNFLYPHFEQFFSGVAPEKIAELATQGVRKKYRRAGMIEQIWQAFFGRLASEGVEFVLAALVVPLFEWYRLLLPDRIHQIGDILPNYIGADSVPAVLDIRGSLVGELVRTVDGTSDSLLTATAGSSSASPEKERME